MSRYFSGANITDALPKALPFDSFAMFVNNWLSAPTICHLTAAEYAAADKATKQAAKNAKYFCACTFGGDGKRRACNFVAANLLVLDVDDARDAARVLSTPLDEILPSNFCLWRTLTSTPDAPRIRLIVDVDALTADEYRSGVAYLGELLEVAVTPESTNTVGLWFAPSRFVDQQDASPIVSSRLTGGPLLASTWAAAEPQGDILPLDTLPATDVSLEDAEAMLALLNPDMGYFAWTGVLCALRHQFGDAALDAFDDWSVKGSKYPGIDAIREKWVTFKGKTRKPVTIRSLIKLAREKGWRPSGARSFADLERQIAAADLTTLSGPLLTAIHDAPLLSPVEVDMLLGRLQQRAKALGAPVRVSTLRTALGTLNGSTAASTAVPAELQGFTYVAELHQWVHPTKGVRLSPVAFDLKFSHLFPDGRPSIDALNTLGLGSVEREGYDPTRPDDLIFKDESGVEHLNSYRKSYPEADPATSAEAGQILNGHLALLFPDATSRGILLDWMSWGLTHPGKRCNWAVFIQGWAGCGKSLIAEALAVCFGSTNSRKVGNDMMSERFNSWISNNQFLFFEEVLLGDRQKDTMEKIKDLITGQTANIRAMRTDAVERANLVSLITFLSNHLHGVRLDRGDRRIFCLCCAQQSDESVAAIPRQHFVALARLKGDLAGGLRHYLLHRSISPAFDPFSHAPSTPDRDLVLRAGASEVDTAVQAVFDAGDNPLVAPDLCSSGEVIRSVRDELRHVTAKQVGRVLLDMGFVRVGQRTIEDERHTVWYNPTVLAGRPWEIFKVRWHNRNEV